MSCYKQMNVKIELYLASFISHYFVIFFLVCYLGDQFLYVEMVPLQPQKWTTPSIQISQGFTNCYKWYVT